jgi:hypothetical protein
MMTQHVVLKVFPLYQRYLAYQLIMKQYENSAAAVLVSYLKF